MDFPKTDRFAAYNKAQPAYEYRPYPKMLQNDDGTTTIVNNEEEHKKIAGKRFDPESLVGSKKGDVDNQQPLVHMAPQPLVAIPDAALMRSGVKMKSLSGNTQTDQIPLMPPAAEK